MPSLKHNTVHYIHIHTYIHTLHRYINATYTTYTFIIYMGYNSK